MTLLLTFGIPALLFAAVVVLLARVGKADRDFTDFTVAGRSFGGLYQAMAFLNTWFPGTVFLANFGLIAAQGAIGFFVLPYSLLAPLVMYAMASRVWRWASAHELRTQPELLALRYGSRAVRPVAAAIGIVALFPWMVLGMQAMGATFSQLSMGALSFTSAVVLGVGVMAVRQYWTIRMGMRGVVVSDLLQGFVAYGLGTAIILYMIAWLYGSGAAIAAAPPAKLALPGLDGPAPLAFFSLVLSGALGGLCWPDLFVRLYTGRSVAAVKLSSAIGAPVALVFFGSLGFLALLASQRPEVAQSPELGFFALALQAGGPLLLALAGTCVFAATMGNIDATVQSCGAQFASDIASALRREPLSERALKVCSQVAMASTTLAAAIVACLPLPQLFTLAVLAYQCVIQLAVPLYLGIFTRAGSAAGAVGGMVGGLAAVAALELQWPGAIPWAYGLTSGVISLAVNLTLFFSLSALVPRSREDEARVAALFEGVSDGAAGGSGRPRHAQVAP